MQVEPQNPRAMTPPGEPQGPETDQGAWRTQIIQEGKAKEDRSHLRESAPNTSLRRCRMGIYAANMPWPGHLSRDSGQGLILRIPWLYLGFPTWLMSQAFCAAIPREQASICALATCAVRVAAHRASWKIMRTRDSAYQLPLLENHFAGSLTLRDSGRIDSVGVGRRPLVTSNFGPGQPLTPC
jgi:hypothetical protein